MATPSINELWAQANLLMINLGMWTNTENPVLRNQIRDTMATLQPLEQTLRGMSFHVAPRRDDILDTMEIDNDEEPDFMETENLVGGVGLVHPVQPGVGRRTIQGQAGDVGRTVPITFIQVASSPPPTITLPAQDRNNLMVPTPPPVPRRRRRSSVKRSHAKKLVDKIKKYVDNKKKEDSSQQKVNCMALSSLVNVCKSKVLLMGR